MHATPVRSVPLPQQRRAREEYAKVPTKGKGEDPGRYSKTPHEYGDILISGGKLGGPLQRDLLYWIERHTWGANTSKNPKVVTRPEFAKLSITALAKLCQVWDEQKGKLRPVERKSVAIALADLEKRGIIEARDRKGCGKTTAKMYKLTPTRWKSAPPYKPPTPKEIEAAELEAEETEAEEAAPVCNSCGQQLSEFAGPAKGERGYVCQNPGCDMEGIELEFLPAPQEPPERTVNPGKVSRPQPVAVTMAKDAPAVTIRLSYCPQGFEHPVTFRSRTGRNGRIQITATPHRPEAARNYGCAQLQSFASSSPVQSAQVLNSELLSEYSAVVRGIVRQYWATAADKSLINQVFKAADNAPVEVFEHRVAQKFRRGAGKHTRGLLIELAADAARDYREFQAEQAAEIAHRSAQEALEAYEAPDMAPEAPQAPPAPRCAVCRGKGSTEKWSSLHGVYAPRPVPCGKCNGTGFCNPISDASRETENSL